MPLRAESEARQSASIVRLIRDDSGERGIFLFEYEVDTLCWIAQNAPILCARTARLVDMMEASTGAIQSVRFRTDSLALLSLRLSVRYIAARRVSILAKGADTVLSSISSTSPRVMYSVHSFSPTSFLRVLRPSPLGLRFTRTEGSASYS